MIRSKPLRYEYGLYVDRYVPFRSILGASVDVSLGSSKTIEQLSRHAYLNSKVIKSQTVIGAD